MSFVREDWQAWEEPLPASQPSPRDAELHHELSAVLFAVIFLAAGALAFQFGAPLTRNANVATPIRTADAALPPAGDFNTFFTQRIQLR